MDTPDKKIQPSPSPSPSPSLVSKFEDSPVFNYISSLSPIKTFSLGQSGQSFPLLTFASPPSSQLSPSISCPVESNVTRVIHVSDLPKNNKCSKSGNKSEITGSSDAVQPADLHIEKVGKFDSGGEVTVSATDESSKIPKSLKYEIPSTEKSEVHCDAVKPDSESNVAITEIIPLKIVQDVSKEANPSLENEISVQEIHLEHNKGVCDWENFIYEASDMLNYHSPTNEKLHEELDDRSVDSGTLNFVATVLQAPKENVDDIQKTESACPFISSENNDIEIPFHKSGAGKSTVTSLVPSVPYSSTEIDDKSCSEQQERTRRRCLVYEMSGAHYRKLLSDPADRSPSSKMAAGPYTSNEKSSIASRPGSNKFSSLLPGIGLHLNALAATTGDKIIVKRQTLTCRRQLISSPCTMPSFDPVNSDVKPLNTQIAPDLAGNVSNDLKDGVQVSGSACQSSTSGEGIQFSQSSPKKKRRKSDMVGETDSCKRCNCKRSKCLKLYCECFAAGLYCVEPCNCQDCLNKPIHEETVLETRRQIESRNPLAFAPKVVMCLSTPHNGDEVNKTPASARHKRGCNCKKSGCLKKYCECFQGGVGCSLSCRCEGCKNTFGQKEGSEAIAIFEEAQMVEKNATSLTSYDEISKTVEENQEEVTQEPSKNARQSVRRPFHFGGNVPQFLPCETQKINRSDESSFEEDVNITSEDEALKVLKGDYSHSTYIKSTSPNCKRVSPHCDFETSPGWRSCRKLILRSVPSFPTSILERKSTKLQEKLE